jgi:hypothetical protein
MKHLSHLREGELSRMILVLRSKSLTEKRKGKCRIAKKN